MTPVANSDGGAGLASLSESVAAYYRELDVALTKLSQGKEGQTSSLPPLALTTRRIRVGVTPSANACVVNVEPDDSLESDHLESVVVSSQESLNDLMSPWETDADLRRIPPDYFMAIQNAQAMVDGERLIDHPLNSPGMRAIGPIQKMLDAFSLDSARSDAISFWNEAENGLPYSDSFVHEARKTFARFSALIKRKAFLERRIHRFLDSHRKLLLPDYSAVYFEVPLFLGHERRVADFILRRDESSPVLLIELENPSHRIVKNRGEWRSEVQHARNQIAEWVQFIDENTTKNANSDSVHGELLFLRGPKQRMVIIGRGLENLDKMISSKYTDTIIWTYDLLIREAKASWTQIVQSQCDVVGLPRIDPF